MFQYCDRYQLNVEALAEIAFIFDIAQRLKTCLSDMVHASAVVCVPLTAWEVRWLVAECYKLGFYLCSCP